MQIYQSQVLNYGKSVSTKLSERELLIKDLNEEINELKKSLKNAQNQKSLDEIKVTAIQEEIKVFREQLKNYAAIKKERDVLRFELSNLETSRINVDILENENSDLKKNISEKLSIIANQSAEIERLELGKERKKSNNRNEDEAFVSLADHNKRIKEYQREQSLLLAQKLNLKEEKAALENQILNLEEKNKEFETRLNKVVLDHNKCYEENQFLQVQIRTYRDDFDEERRLREKSQSDRALLTSECQLLQARNEKLTLELDKYTK